MKNYIGTKHIKAKPMTRVDYNTYRGWKLPDDEDGSDEGYLVEQTIEGKPNHPDHEGYISWSPKDVFPYQIAETFIDRLKIEIDDLEQRRFKLFKFMASSGKVSLSKRQISLLTEQLSVMEEYKAILHSRIDQLSKEGESE